MRPAVIDFVATSALLMGVSMMIGPKRKDRRHYSYDEGADEPAGLIDKESTDIEAENPIDDTEAVEQVDKAENKASIFEE